MKMKRYWYIAEDAEGNKHTCHVDTAGPAPIAGQRVIIKQETGRIVELIDEPEPEKASEVIDNRKTTG